MRTLALTLSAAALAIAACQTPRTPSPPQPPPSARTSPDVFNRSDMAWSAIPGGNRIDGRIAYRQGSTAYTCTVVALIPETPFSARRMQTSYGSSVGAIVAAEQVRARSTPAPAGFDDFRRDARCDGQGRFSFQDLPDGAWFVVAPVRPVAGSGQQMALMRRVVTRGGRAVSLDL